VRDPYFVKLVVWERNYNIAVRWDSCLLES